MTHTGTSTMVRLIVCATAAAFPAVLIAQPSNDHRAAAAAITLGHSASGTTEGATNDGGIFGACSQSGLSPDVWYRYDCFASGMIVVSTCGGSPFRTVLQVFNVDPGNGLGVERGCGGGNGPCGPNESRVLFEATSGHAYWVRVAGADGTGSFLLTVDNAPATPVWPPAHPPQSQPTLPPLPFAPTRSSGPDLTVADITRVLPQAGGAVWMADSSSAGLVDRIFGYQFDTAYWNIGDIPVEWPPIGAGPVTGEQLYRLKDGRLEQVGMSWLLHGISSRNEATYPGLGPCDTPTQDAGSRLGVNCAAHVSTLQLQQQDPPNGDFFLPRYDSDARTGWALFSYQDLGEQNALSRRVVASFDDVGGDLNAGALYFVEAACVAADDALWGNGRNNYAARVLNAGTMLSTSIGFFGQAYGRTSALELWSRMDTSVRLSRVNYVESTATFTDTWRHWTPSQPFAVQMPAGLWTTVTTNQNGRFIAASKVFDNGDGTYDYEYAVLNVDSGRSGNLFEVRAASGVSDIGFRAPKYHSGDRVLNNPWLNNGGAGGAVRWSVDPATAAYVPPNQSSRVGFEPNTLRWGTMYNFRFRASTPPLIGSARLGLTPPYDGTGFQGSSLAVENLSVPAFCTADVGSAGGMSGPDGVLDNNDFIAFIDAFFNGDLLMADVGKAGGLVGPDSQLDNNDFIVYINGFFAGCN